MQILMGGAERKMIEGGEDNKERELPFSEELKKLGRSNFTSLICWCRNGGAR